MQRWWIGIGLAVFAAAAVVGFAVARPLAPASLHREVETRLAELLGGPVHVRDLRVSLRWGVLLHGEDVTVWPAEGGPALHVDRATVELRPFSHLTGQRRVRTLRLEGPVLRVTHHPDASITPAAVAALLTGPDDAESAAEGQPAELVRPLAALERFARSVLERLVVADSFEIEGGRIELVDLAAASPRTFAVTPVQARLTHSLLGETKLTLRGRLRDAAGDRGSFEWKGGRGPEGPLHMALAVTRLDLAAVLPWVRQLRPHARLGGRLSGALEFESPEPGRGRLEVDLVARNLESEPPVRRRGPLEAERVALKGTLTIGPDRVRVEGARFSSDNLSLEVDATLGRPLRPDSSAELALAVRDVTVADLRHLIGWLPQVRREEAEALLASVKEGRLRLLRTGGTATLRGWQAFLAGRTRTLPRDFVVDAHLVDTTVHVGGEDHLEALAGRLWWTGDRVELRNFSARLDGSPLPRLDLAMDGVSHLFASNPAAREIAPGAPPLEGLRTLWLATRGDSDGTGSRASFQLDVDHLHHPMFYWPIEDALARLERLPGGVRISIERGRWAGVPVAGEVYWTFEPSERVRARLTASAAPDSPTPAETNDTWARGRFSMGPVASKKWTHERMQGEFEARGGTLKVHDVEIALAPRGRARASGHLDLGRADAVPVGLRFELEGGDLASLAASVGLPRHLTTGTLTADGSLTTTLRAETSSAADLTGRIRLDARDGTIGRAVPAALAIALASETLNPFARRERVRYDSLQTELSLEAGMLHSEALSLEGPDVRAFASGGVDIAREPHDLDVEVVLFLFRPVDSLLGLIPIVNLLVLGPNDNLVAAHYRLEGPWGDPKATLLPFRSFASGPGTLIFETLPSLVRRGLQALDMLFDGGKPEPPRGPAAIPES